jgi:hypothetical protein
LEFLKNGKNLKFSDNRMVRNCALSGSVVNGVERVLPEL